MPVFCTWEEVNAYIYPEHMRTATVAKGDETERCECLIIDVNEY